VSLSIRDVGKLLDCQIVGGDRQPGIETTQALTIGVGTCGLQIKKSDKSFSIH